MCVCICMYITCMCVYVNIYIYIYISDQFSLSTLRSPYITHNTISNCSKLSWSSRALIISTPPPITHPKSKR